MTSPGKYWYGETVAALFVLLFTYTAIDKLRHYTSFARAILHSSLIAPHARALAAIVPGLELLTVALLIIPATRHAGLWVATITMLTFTLYIIYILATASELPCTCAGLFEHMSWRQHLLFNTSFLAMGIAALVLSHQDFTRINRSRRLPV